MKRESNKRDLILDAMQGMMMDSSTVSVSVSDIARRAGIGKGSIYYYFRSKEDILDAVIERFLFDTIERCSLAEGSDQGVFEKLEAVFNACREFSPESGDSDTADLLRAQNAAWIHQKYVSVLVGRVSPILAGIIRQGTREGKITCDYPAELSELVILVLAIKLDRQRKPPAKEGHATFLHMFRDLLQRGLVTEPGALSFLTV